VQLFLQELEKKQKNNNNNIENDDENYSALLQKGVYQGWLRTIVGPQIINIFQQKQQQSKSKSRTLASNDRNDRGRSGL
jgi:hypothetical protein